MAAFDWEEGEENSGTPSEKREQKMSTIQVKLTVFAASNRNVGTINIQIY